jgi:hypothetical protein
MARLISEAQQLIAHTRLAPRVRARWPRKGPATCTGLTGRCRGRQYVASLRPRQAGAPELGR